MQIQKSQNTMLTFGIKPISREQAIKIGNEFYRFPFGNPGGEIVKHMDTYDEFKLVVENVFRQDAEVLEETRGGLDFVTKVISNITPLAASCKHSVLAAFPQLAETGATQKLYEDATMTFVDDITTALSRAFGKNREKLSSSSRGPSIFVS